MFSKLFGKKQEPAPEVSTIANCPDLFEFEIVGESKYQKQLNKICGGRTEDGHWLEKNAYLVLEDENPHDKKAVRVDIDGHTVGYFDRRTARGFRKLVSASDSDDRRFCCPAVIVGGWDRGNGETGYFGVKLDLEID